MSDNTTFQVRRDSSQDEEAQVKEPCLVMIEGDRMGEVFQIDQATIVIGRSEDADIPLADTGISRRHAMIERIDDEHFVLSDLKSTNGTEINGRPVTESPLREGDKIRLGNVLFKFTRQDQLETDYHHQLRNLAIRDGLTKVYNKRYFLEALEKEFSYVSRHQANLSLIIFDIDHFKRVNDTYGHEAGDFVLTQLAQIIDQRVRGYDLFARYGGEEFVALVRDADPHTALLLAERMRQAIDQHVFTFNGQTIPVTISIGVASMTEKCRFNDHLELLRSADEFLYEAKRNGRNCTVPALKAS